MNLFEYVENIYRFGLEFFRRYYGPYRALVVSNKDPLHQGRIQIECPRARLNSNNNIWVYPMMYGAGQDKGIFWPPDTNDAVWVFFDNGDPTLPLGYVGGWYGGRPLTELSADLNPDSDSHTPNRRGFISPGGAKIILDDTSGSEQITIENSDGMRVLLTKDNVQIGNKNGEYEQVFKAETVKEWLANHTHSSSMGPTGVPIVPFPENGLSTDVKNS